MIIQNINFKRSLILLFCILGLITINSVEALADSYNVTAVVPYDPPTIASTITSPVSNSTVNLGSIDISGTCQILNPATIVSAWNGTTFLGSTSCLSGGTYSLNIPLFIGSNVLIIKTSNINSVYGPDSSGHTITYTPSASTEEPNSNQESSINNPTITPNNPINGEELFLTTTDPFGVSNNDNYVAITFTIGGGNNPYDLLINWGDGSTQTQQVNESGNYTFTHTYEKPATYKVLARLTDSMGRIRNIEWLVTSKQLPTSPPIGTIVNSDGTVVLTSFRFYTYISFFILFIFFIFLTFLLGRYYQSKKDDELLTKKATRKRKPAH